MIAVIADDFTGAAEIGGIGLRRGLRTVIKTGLHKAEDADLLIITTDTRSGSVDNSISRTEMVTKYLISLAPLLIYKKLDSVLRGNVAPELLAQMRTEQKMKAVVVAGNPYLGRTIRDGVYYVNNTPVAETYFARDPEFPVCSSVITEIIGRQWSDLYSLAPGQPIPGKGLIFGDVRDETDMEKWAAEIDDKTVPAGGAGFFDTLLRRYYPGNTELPGGKLCRLGKKVLFVFGSAYPKNPEQTFLLQQKEFLFMNLPEAVYTNHHNNQHLLDAWSEDICRKLDDHGKVIINVSMEAGNDVRFSGRIRECMGLAVKSVFEKTTVDDLLTEGGATTSVILNYLGISRLYPFRELGSGVIQMKTDKFPGLRITTKPGSYQWPECLMINLTRKSLKKTMVTDHH